MARRPQRPERRFDQLVARIDQRAEDAAPGVAVDPQACRRVPEGSLEHHGRAVVEWVGERSRGMDPLDAVLLERHGPHERRRETERVDRRARVMPKAG